MEWFCRRGEHTVVDREHLIDHAELRMRAVEVLPRARRAEVHIPFEVIGKEPHPAFVGHEDRAHGEIPPLRLRDTVADGGEVTRKIGLIEVKAEMHPGEIGLVLRAGVAAEANTVAEVVAQRPGHDRIEVNDSDSLPRLIVQHDVIELGIVVRHAERYFPALNSVDDLPAQRGMLFYPCDLPLYLMCPPADVCLHGGEEVPVPHAGVMEIGQDLIELRRVELCEERGKATECHRALVEVPGCAHRLIGRRPLDEHIDTEIVRAVKIVALSRLCRHNLQALARGVAAAGEYALAAERRHEFDVVHELPDVFEQAVIDALEDIAGLLSLPLHRQAKGIIDMPRAVTDTGDIRPVHGKMGYKFAEKCVVLYHSVHCQYSRFFSAIAVFNSSSNASKSLSAWV